MTHSGLRPGLDVADIPWRLIHNLVGAIRRRYFTVPRPQEPGLRIPMEAREIATRLEEFAHYESGWQASYQYHGEDYNLRRPSGTTSIQGERVQMQTHVRLFDESERAGEPRTLVLPHREPSPLQHPRLHVTGEHLSWEGGRRRLEDTLAGLDIRSTEVTPDHE